MPVQFTIRITKEIIEHCKSCGTENNKQEIGSNCAVAFALKDIFPDVFVTDYYIFPFGMNTENGKDMKITMPEDYLYSRDRNYANMKTMIEIDLL